MLVFFPAWYLFDEIPFVVLVVRMSCRRLWGKAEELQEQAATSGWQAPIPFCVWVLQEGQTIKETQAKSPEETTVQKDGRFTNCYASWRWKHRQPRFSSLKAKHSWFSFINQFRSPPQPRSYLCSSSCSKRENWSFARANRNLAGLLWSN